MLAALALTACRGWIEPHAAAEPAPVVVEPTPVPAEQQAAVPEAGVDSDPASREAGDRWNVSALQAQLAEHANDQAGFYDHDLAPPAPEPAIDVVVISDLNSSYGSTEYRDSVHVAVDAIIARQPDVVLVTGDMVAGQRSGLDYRGMWRGFHAAVSDPLAAAGIPIAVTPGNHDASELPRFARERRIFEEEWLARRPEVRFLDDEHYPLRYAFAMGPALFVSLDATYIGPLPEEQMAWLDRVLSEWEAYPVKVVFGHMPLYPFSGIKRDEVIGDPELEAMLVGHGVTAMISGHHHAWYPGRRDTLRLVGMPCLGSGVRSLIGQSEPSPTGFASFRVTPRGFVELDAWTGAEMDERIDRATLPEWIGHGETIIVRDDL